MATPLPITLEGWKPVTKGSLRGFATIRLGKTLRIKDVTVLTSHGKNWASLPSKPMIGADGTTIKKDGKTQYVPILEWTDKAASDRFSEAVVAAVEAEYPGALT